MQWASSTVMKLTFMCLNFVRKKGEESRSGDKYKNFMSPKIQLSRIFTCSLCVCSEDMAYAGMESLRRCSTWSFIRDMSGVMTMHTPSIARAGTWNVMDLPPPVGISPRVSCPDPMLSIISRCIPRKSSYPQYLRNIAL